MPRWPEKVTHLEEHITKSMDLEAKELPAQGETFDLPHVQEESTAEDTGLPINDTNILVRSLSQRVDDLSTAFMRMIDALNGHIPLFEVLPSAELNKLQRRRSLDDMQFALRRMTQPEPRPADDDSPQVLQDAINEVIALRQIINDMMQANSTVYQNGLVAIRNMTNQ